LDDDSAGREALKGLRRGGPNRKQLLKPEYILPIGSLDGVRLPGGRQPKETEDLIPPSIAALPVQRYVQTVCGTPRGEAERLTPELILSHWAGESGLLDTVRTATMAVVGEDAHVDKVGFAQAVVEVLQRHHASGEYAVSSADLETFDHNVGQLLARLAAMQRQAERESTQERISRRLDRAVKSFLRDHPTGCRREDALILLEDIESVLDSSQEADYVRMQVQALRRRFDLNEPKPGPVEDFPGFTEGLCRVRYSAVNAVQEEVPNLFGLRTPVTPGESAARPIRRRPERPRSSLARQAPHDAEFGTPLVGGPVRFGLRTTPSRHRVSHFAPVTGHG
jgi:hypothetical protein